jgi:TolB-like protein
VGAAAIASFSCGSSLTFNCITEDIITDLSKISGLHVVARNTVFTYKNKPTKVQRAAQELGVRFVLEGSVRKAGTRVRITGQLIDGKDGSHVWADRYDRELTDIFAIQDEITHAISEKYSCSGSPLMLLNGRMAIVALFGNLGELGWSGWIATGRGCRHTR